MKCGKCGGIWETNPKFKYCPFCGFLLPEEDISAILPGPAKMIKSFADRFGAEIFKDKSRCYTLFRTFINDNKEIAMMEFLLNSGAVEEILKCSAGFSEFDKERLCLKIKENLMKDFCSDTRLTEGLNWYTSALINFELKVASPVSRTIITSPSSGISPSLPATSPAGTISSIKKSGVTNTSTLEEFERYVRGKYALDLVKCPAGSFFMGSPMTELGRFKNEVQHKVTITRDFCIGKYPVTQALYKMIMGDNPSQFKGNTNPVECVIWSKAYTYRAGDAVVVCGQQTKGYMPVIFRGQIGYVDSMNLTSAYVDYKQLAQEIEFVNENSVTQVNADDIVSEPTQSSHVWAIILIIIVVILGAVGVAAAVYAIRKL